MASDYLIVRLADEIRRNTDEPSAKAKYTDDNLIQRAQDAFNEVMTDLNCIADNRITCDTSITLSSDATRYLLPPHMERLLRIAIINETNGLPDIVWEPRSKDNPFGPGFWIEGRTLRLEPSWSQGSEEKTVQVRFVPNADFMLHYGTAVSYTATTVTLTGTPTAGAVDTRENAYAGSTVRVINDGHGFMQERTITSYVRSGRIATVDIAFDPVPIGTVNYEIVPHYWRSLERVVALHVAMDIAATMKDTKRLLTLNDRYLRSMRVLRGKFAQMQVASSRFEHDTRRGVSMFRGVNMPNIGGLLP